MKAQATLVLVWLLAGVGAVAGSILVGALGKTGLFIGALAGGSTLAALGVVLAVRLGWLSKPERRSAAWGAVAGFFVAAPIAVANLHTPVTPILVCSFAGVGALIGAGIARRSASRRGQ